MFKTIATPWNMLNMCSDVLFLITGWYDAIVEKWLAHVETLLQFVDSFLQIVKQC